MPCGGETEKNMGKGERRKSNESTKVHASDDVMWRRHVGVTATHRVQRMQKHQLIWISVFL